METFSAIARSVAATMGRVMAPTLTAPRAWRLSIVHQLVLLLVAAVLLAVSVLGGVVAWNLRAGFSDYLRLQEEDWLLRFTAEASTAVEQRGLGAITGGPGTLRPLFDAVAPLGGRTRGPAGGPPGPPRGGGPERGDLPGPPGRVSLVSPDGHHLSGRRLSPDDPVLQRDVVVNGQTVARARLLQGRAVTQAVDAAFLARQYRGIVVTALVLLLLAVVGAVWVGRRWLQPVQAAQQAARRMAQGAFDVRLQPQGNDELADLAHDINAMAASLQDLESSRRRWIAELSHEMRTPLAVLQGEVEALIDGVRPLGPAALVSLQEEVARVSRLVQDFHQLALSDLRALPCHFAPVQPQHVLQEAAARVQARMHAAGLQLGITTPPAPPLQAHWDAQRIDQLLANLLENSLRYTDPPGRVQLLLAAAGTAAAPHLQITVQDSAPCVPIADLPRLFDPLYRADPSRARRSGGSGLGLAICRAIVVSHGGRIEAQRSVLGGLCVVVTLPAQAGPPGGPAP